LKTEFVTRFHHSLMMKQKKLFYVQNALKKMLITANIYYIDIAKKRYLFYNYEYL